MPSFIFIVNKYVRSELLILVPVLFVIKKMLISSKVKSERIPVILMVIAIVCSGLYTFSTVDIPNLHGILFAIFTSLMQGVILSGGAMFGDMLLPKSPVVTNDVPPKSDSSDPLVK